MWDWIKRLFESRKARQAPRIEECEWRPPEDPATARRYRRTTFVPSPPPEAPRRQPKREDSATAAYYKAIALHQIKQREADRRHALRQPAPAYSRRKDDEQRDTMAGTYLDPTNPLSPASPLNPIYSSSSDPAPPGSCDSGSSSTDSGSSSSSSDSGSCSAPGGGDGGSW